MKFVQPDFYTKKNIKLEVIEIKGDTVTFTVSIVNDKKKTVLTLDEPIEMKAGGMFFVENLIFDLDDYSR